MKNSIAIRRHTYGRACGKMFENYISVQVDNGYFNIVAIFTLLISLLIKIELVTYFE